MTNTMNQPAIDLEDIHKRFVQARSFRSWLKAPNARDHLGVLSGIDLAVKQGEALGVVGVNGAGKTTLLKVIAGLVRPDRGQVRILGIDPVPHPREAHTQIGFVMSSERSFFWRLTARQNLRFFGRLRGIPKRELEDLIPEALSTVGLIHRIDNAFRELSDGMRQRLAIARALINQPEILLVDEATRSVDPTSAIRLRRFLKEQWVERLGHTLMIVSHHLDELQEVCGRTVLLEEGRISLQGETAQVLPEIRAKMSKAAQHSEGDSQWVALESSGYSLRSFRGTEEGTY